MDTEKQRQHRCNDTRLTKNGNARSDQLLMVPTESLTNREWPPGELLSGSEHQRPSWFLDVKYQTCFLAGEVCPHREQASSVLSFVLWTIDSSITLAALAENSLTPQLSMPLRIPIYPCSYI